MGNIVRAQVSIVGTRPILFHGFGPDAIPLEKQERTGVAGNDPEEWRSTVRMTADRQLFLDPSYIFGCLRDGARYIKQGRGSLQVPLCATLQVEDNRVLLDRYVPEEPIPTDPDAPVYMDIRSVRNPATKGRNVRYRIAASPGWQASFSIIWDKTVVARAQMEAVLTEASRLVGLADGRSIGFGRFCISSFDVTEA